MKIASSVVELGARHQLVEADEKREDLKLWVDGPGKSRSRRGEAPPGLMRQTDTVSLSHRPHRQTCNDSKTSQVGESSCVDDDDLSGDPKVMLAKMVVEAITGKKIKLFDPSGSKSEGSAEIPPSENAPVESAPASQQEGWGMIYNRFESHYEQESLSFAAQGNIRTEDGRSLSFSLEIAMSREFYSEAAETLRAGDARKVDPLVIHFGEVADSLTGARFSFDLNADGTKEDLTFVGRNSGLVALDLNGDGQVNDGRELFGPGTGNGFSELAAYDDDANGWIDENDSVFDRLSVWTKDAEGNDRLNSFKISGVGAIYLNNVDSPFALKDSSNQLQAEVVRSGVALMESGEAKVIQQVDMVV